MSRHADDLGESAALSPAELLAEGFAQHVERWARALRCDAATLGALRRAAFETSLATSNGHVCVALADLVEPDETRGSAGPPTDQAGAASAALRRTLLASGLVGSAEAPGACPLVLDAGDRLYLHRYFDYERRLARRLMRAAGVAPGVIDTATRALLGELFRSDHALGTVEVDWQKVAAALTLRQHLVVISGGPGTGKTATVVKLLAGLVAQDPACRIALAAPTGKAAARLGEAIASRATTLPQRIRERLPVDAATVHRLLGATSGGGFAHHAARPLAVDVLVVDEASMLDLALATRLLEAVPPTARIILLGDKDQLAAVESGAVFAELSTDPSLGDGCRNDLAELCGVAAAAIAPAAAVQPSALHDAAVWFTRNYRFAVDSGIACLALDIRDGRVPQALARLRDASDGTLQWIVDGGIAPDAATLQRLRGGYARYFDALLRDPSDVAAIAQAFGTFRALCALRDGPRGVDAINAWLTQHARAVLAPLIEHCHADARSPWFPGRPVMVLRNDPVSRLFNGDIGITLPSATGGSAVGADAEDALRVYFPDAAGAWRAIAPVRLPAHRTAFAMTVHKAQGSEFDDVLVLLPAQRSRVATRELVYTAVTRARDHVTLAASADVLAAAIESPTRRRSGLLERLREAATSSSDAPPAA